MNFITKVRELWTVPGEWVETGTNLPAQAARPHLPTPKRDPNYLPTGYDAGEAYYEEYRLVGMKLVAVANGRYYSISRPEIEYRIGAQYEQLARPNHGGGYYVFLTDSALQLVQKLNDGGLIDTGAGVYGVLECMCYGPFVGYDWNGQMIPLQYMENVKKVACTRLIPTHFHGTFEYPGSMPVGYRPAANITVTRRGYYG